MPVWATVKITLLTLKCDLETDLFKLSQEVQIIFNSTELNRKIQE